MMLVIFMLCGWILRAQTLPSFTLNVSVTNETCTGNGALGMSVSGHDPEANITYNVYKSPNFATAVAVLQGSSNNITGLTSGTYRVVATQTKAGYISNSQIWNGSISTSIVPLHFTATSTNEICGADGAVTVNVTSGSVATNGYSLYNSNGTTLIRGPQSSNVFSNLAEGNYLVSVKNSCGENITQTAVVSKLTPFVNFKNIGHQEDPSVGSCKVTMFFDVNTATAQQVINYPIQVKVTTYAPDGTVADVINETKNEADFTSVTNHRRYYYSIPFYASQAYQHTIEITDACGNVFTKNTDITLNPSILVNKYTTCQGSFLHCLVTS